MTRQLTSDDRATAVRNRSGPARAAAPYVLLGLVAFLARLLPTLRGGGLSGLGVYDDAVYYSGAAALVAGRVPYADFVLLHPPGVVLALAPFAALGRLTSDPAGFAVARVAFMALGVLNTVLVARLARRFGLVAAVVAGLFYALWYPAAAAEARTMIEPLGSLVVLLCLVLLLPREGVPSRRATVLAGVLLGLSLGLKIWAVAPVAIVVLWQLVVAGRAATARLLAGVLAGAAAIWVPFLLLAPGPMVRMVVADQVGRPRMGVTIGGRLRAVLTLAPHLAGAPAATKQAVLALALVVVVAAAAAAWSRRRARVVVLLLGVTTLVLLAGPSYFQHYASFPAPFLALVVGIGCGVLLERLPRPVAVTGALAAVVVITLAAVTPMSRHLNDPFPGTQLGRLAVGRGCVTSDDPGALILMNVLTRDLDRGCPQPVDFTGQTYDDSYAAQSRPSGTPVPRRANQRWQAVAVHQLTTGSATVLARLGHDGFDLATMRRLRALPVVGTVGGYAVIGR